jgi:RNA polymerase primary sigma factor
LPESAIIVTENVSEVEPHEPKELHELGMQNSVEPVIDQVAEIETLEDDEIEQFYDSMLPGGLPERLDLRTRQRILARRHARLNGTENSHATYRGEDILDDFRDQSGRYAVPTAAEVKVLGKQLLAGRFAEEAILNGEDASDFITTIENAREAKERLLHGNLRLLISVAVRFMVPDGMERMDLIKSGYFGLNKAVERYDIRKGFSFSTYATLVIRGEIKRATKEGVMIQIWTQILRETRRAHAEVQADRLKPSGKTDKQLDPVQERIIAMTNLRSLDLPIAGSDNLTLGDGIIGETASSIDKHIESWDLHAAILELPENQQEVITRFWGIGRPKESIAQASETLGISMATLSRWKKAAETQLAEILSSPAS